MGEKKNQFFRATVEMLIVGLAVIDFRSSLNSPCINKKLEVDNNELSLIIRLLREIDRGQNNHSTVGIGKQSRNTNFGFTHINTDVC